MNKSFINQVFYKSSQKMTEIPDFSVDLIITSPPYFNIKDYSKDYNLFYNYKTSYYFVLICSIKETI